MLFEDLVKIAGYELHYQENMETYENEYWLPIRELKREKKYGSKLL